jgi:hypothetical protein
VLAGWVGLVFNTVERRKSKASEHWYLSTLWAFLQGFSHYPGAGVETGTQHIR